MTDGKKILLATPHESELKMLSLWLSHIGGHDEMNLTKIKDQASLDEIVKPDNENTPQSPMVLILDTDLVQDSYQITAVNVIETLEKIRSEDSRLSRTPIIIIDPWCMGSLIAYVNNHPEMNIKLFQKPYKVSELLNALKQYEIHE